MTTLATIETTDTDSGVEAPDTEPVEQTTDSPSLFVAPPASDSSEDTEQHTESPEPVQTVTKRQKPSGNQSRWKRLEDMRLDLFGRAPIVGLFYDSVPAFVLTRKITKNETPLSLHLTAIVLGEIKKQVESAEKKLAQAPQPETTEVSTEPAADAAPEASATEADPVKATPANVPAKAPPAPRLGFEPMEPAEVRRIVDSVSYEPHPAVAALSDDEVRVLCADFIKTAADGGEERAFKSLMALDSMVFKRLGMGLHMQLGVIRRAARRTPAPAKATTTFTVEEVEAERQRLVAVYSEFPDAIGSFAEPIESDLDARGLKEAMRGLAVLDLWDRVNEVNRRLSVADIARLPETVTSKINFPDSLSRDANWTTINAWKKAVERAESLGGTTGPQSAGTARKGGRFNSAAAAQRAAANKAAASAGKSGKKDKDK